MTQENQTHVKDTAKNVMARNNPLAQGRQPVSYTHLTLPTNSLV